MLFTSVIFTLFMLVFLPIAIAYTIGQEEKERRYWEGRARLDKEFEDEKRRTF